MSEKYISFHRAIRQILCFSVKKEKNIHLPLFLLRRNLLSLNSCLKDIFFSLVENAIGICIHSCLANSPTLSAMFLFDDKGRTDFQGWSQSRGRGRFLFELGIIFSTEGYFVHTLWMVEARTGDRLSAVSTGLMLPISQN